MGKDVEETGSWPNLRYFPSICLDGLRRITKNHSITDLGTDLYQRLHNTKQSANHSVLTLVVYIKNSLSASAVVFREMTVLDF
jgi:ABC-type transport system involved in multi-copper enzyme maturation permease subunit